MAVDLAQPDAETVEAVRVAIYRALARTGRLPRGGALAELAGSHILSLIHI